MFLRVGPQFFKRLGATSKLYVSEGRIEVTDTPKAPKYYVISLQIKFPPPLGKWVYGQPPHTSNETVS